MQKIVKKLIENLTSSFKVVYKNFNCQEFSPYLKRKIGAIIRFDEKTVYIHTGLTEREEKLTWLHEALSVFYYQNNIFRHDEEIEKEARKMYEDSQACLILEDYIKKYKKRIKNESSKRARKQQG